MFLKPFPRKEVLWTLRRYNGGAIWDEEQFEPQRLSRELCDMAEDCVLRAAATRVNTVVGPLAEIAFSATVLMLTPEECVLFCVICADRTWMHWLRTLFWFPARGYPRLSRMLWGGNLWFTLAAAQRYTGLVDERMSTPLTCISEPAPPPGQFCTRTRAPSTSPERTGTVEPQDRE